MPTDTESATEISADTMPKEEINQLVKPLSKMKMKPTADILENLMKWMSSLVGTKTPVAEFSTLRQSIWSIHTNRRLSFTLQAANTHLKVLRRWGV
jgi:hypothetical protein